MEYVLFDVGSGLVSLDDQNITEIHDGFHDRYFTLSFFLNISTYVYVYVHFYHNNWTRRKNNQSVLILTTIITEMKN